MSNTLAPFIFFLLSFFIFPSQSSVVFPSPTTTTRRLLHQPFLPLDSLPPSESPLPPPNTNANPKYPFSLTTPPTPPVDYPFFPTVASPPPPPSPATFASFPANISSLIVPHSDSSKRGSNKLVALSIAAVVSALAVLAVAVLFFYYRRRSSRSEFSDDKTLRSESSSRFFAAVGNNAERSTPQAQKLRTGSASGSASSEFLYLGTLVDSRRIEGGPNSSSRNGRLDPRKMDSPELHPLPPLLARRNVNGGSDMGNGTEMTSTVEEEEEEFYSPKGSIGTGSGSRRVFAAVEEVESLSSSSSSSASSPDRSQSISYSPPVSFSPKRQESNLSVPRRPPPPPPPQPQQTRCVTASPASSPNSSPERAALKSSALSDPMQNVRSPSLSPISSPEIAPIAENTKLRSSSSLSSSSSSTPERISEMKSLIATLNKQSRSPTLSASSSTKESPARASDTSAQKWQIVSSERDFDNHSVETSSISNDSVELTFEFDPHRLSLSARSSPERVSEKNQDSPPRVSDASEPDRKRHSPSLSLSSSSSTSPARLSNASDRRSQIQSPERLSAEPKDASLEGILTESDLKSRSLSPSPPSSSPERDSHNNPDGSPRTSGDSDRGPDPPIIVSEQRLTIPKPPPLPPQWEAHSPTLATPVYRHPPALLPPSRPFVLQAPADLSVSPMELPPRSSTSPEASAAEEDAPKPKLKPLHWDKVRASSDREMVWDQLRSSSFKLNEEMIETLFVVKTPNPKPKEITPRSALPSPNMENRVLDPKKSQNIAISLRALNVTIEEVCEALLEGNADALGNELLESLMKMAPTKEEERKLMEYKDNSPVKLGPAEKFLKAVLDVPFTFKRVEAMLYVANFDSEVDYLKKSFETLEGACEELRNSRMFMKLLEAVLKTGNRMNVGTNRGDAHAFKLDTLLKLIDIKGADGKTTLLHFVVQEIIRSEGARSAIPTEAEDDARCRRLGLQVVSALASDLAGVKRAATMDSDILAGEVSRLSKGVGEIREVVSRVGPGRFSESMKGFARRAEEEIIRIQAQESVALSLVKEITEYFHGNSAKEEAHPFRIFMVVRDFLSVLDRVCKEVGMINERTTVSSAHKFPVPMNPMLAQVLPVPKKPYSSSDKEGSSP